MNTTTRHLLITPLAVAALGLTLAGCSGLTANHFGAQPATHASVPARSQSSPSTPSATPTSTSAGSGTGTTTGTGASSKAPAVTTGLASCPGTSLTGSLTAGDGGAAGSTLPDLVLTNHSSTTCTLQGWPGVSFVGLGNGTQLGSAAQQNRAVPHPTATLKPGGSATVPLRVANAEDFPAASCGPIAADGFRVYPPGSKSALFVKATGFTACTKTSAQLLFVSAVLPRS